MYRGYPIEQLAEKSNYLEVCYLLLYGELPNQAQMDDFQHRVTNHTMLHEQMHFLYRGFRRDAHPMAVVCGVVGAMAAFYHDSTDINDPMQREIASIRLIAKIPTIVAMSYKYSIGQPFVYPRNDLDYASNFLNMCFSVPAESYNVNPVIARAMDLIFTLHADHEQNASTSTVRLAGSSDANPFACIAAGVACLWGPAHGGANEAALNMLKEIGTPDRIPEFIARVKDKSSGVRLMGFGHRVYKNYDPRAKVMQETAKEVLGLLNVADNPLLQVAQQLEHIALTDEYFISRKLYPNVDFYSGIILEAIGFPTSMFTAIFALSRTVGLDCSVEGNDRRSAEEDRASASALPRLAGPRLRPDRQALGRPARQVCQDPVDRVLPRRTRISRRQQVSQPEERCRLSRPGCRIAQKALRCGDQPLGVGVRLQDFGDNVLVQHNVGQRHALLRVQFVQAAQPPLHHVSEDYRHAGECQFEHGRTGSGDGEQRLRVEPRPLGSLRDEPDWHGPVFQLFAQQRHEMWQGGQIEPRDLRLARQLLRRASEQWQMPAQFARAAAR